MPRGKSGELKCELCENKNGDRCPADEKNWRGRRTPKAKDLNRQRIRDGYCEEWVPIWDNGWT